MEKATEYKLTIGGKTLVTLSADRDMPPAEALQRIIEALIPYTNQEEKKEEGAPT